MKCKWFYIYVVTLLLVVVTGINVYAAEKGTAVTFKEAFPDAGFRSFVFSQLDSKKTDDDVITKKDETELAKVTNVMLDIVSFYESPIKVTDLTGLSYFTGMKLFLCQGADMKFIELVDFPELEFIMCNGWPGVLSSANKPFYFLRVSNCPSLTSINCNDNLLTELIIENCPALESLDCSNNNLFSLKLSGSPKLKTLNCEWNQLTSLDMSGYPALEYLDCSGNGLTLLKLSNKPALMELYCSENLLVTLDVSACPGLEVLDCDDNRLNRLQLLKNTKLMQLYASGNELEELDLSMNKKLDDLSCKDNLLKVLNISNNPELVILDCSFNQLTRLDISKNNKLAYLECNYNYLTNLDFSKNNVLEIISCYGNYMGENPDNSIPGWKKRFKKVDTYDSEFWYYMDFIYYPQSASDAEMEAAAIRTQGITVLLDGKTLRLSHDIYEDNGCVLVPVEIFEHLGAGLSWNDKKKMLTVNLAGVQIDVRLRSITAYVDGSAMELDSPPRFIQGIMYVPLENAMQLCNEKTAWEPGKKVVSISTEAYYDPDLLLYLNHLSANYFICNQRDFAFVGGAARNKNEAIAARSSLQQDWRVGSREESLITIFALYNGLQDMPFFTQNETTVSKGIPGVLAWDICRISQVTGLAYLSGYLDLDECVALIKPAAIIAQELFDDWEDLDANYVYGSAYSLNIDLNNPDKALKQRMDAHIQYKENYLKNCPDWDFPLFIE